MPRAMYSCAVSLKDTLHSMAQCSAMLHGGTLHGMASHGEASHSTTPSGAAPHSTTLHSMAPHRSESDSEPPSGVMSPRAMYGCTVLLKDTPHGMAQCGAMLHGRTLHGTVSHGEASHGTTPSGTALHGVTLCSMAPHQSESDSKPPSGAMSPRAMYGCAVSLKDTPHGVAQCGAMLHGGTPHGTALHGAALHGTAFYLSPSISRERASPRAARRDVPATQACACCLLDEDPCGGAGASSSLSCADFDNSAG